MARKTPNLLLRDGRYYARKIVPSNLRPYVGRNELRAPLGADRRIALENLPEAMVRIKARLDYARRALEADKGAEAARAATRAAPMSAEEIGRVCAFTGARVAEVLQLRKSDVRTHGDITYVHITPEAGPVKGKKYRDVPLHPQLVEIGFLDFVAKCPDGPLFHSLEADPEKAPAQAVSARVGKWLQTEGLVPDGVQPNHGWRHRFKTLAREAGLDPHVVDIRLATTKGQNRTATTFDFGASLNSLPTALSGSRPPFKVSEGSSMNLLRSRSLNLPSPSPPSAREVRQ